MKLEYLLHTNPSAHHCSIYNRFLIWEEKDKAQKASFWKIRIIPNSEKPICQMDKEMPQNASSNLLTYIKSEGLDIGDDVALTLLFILFIFLLFLI